MQLYTFLFGLYQHQYVAEHYSDADTDSRFDLARGGETGGEGVAQVVKLHRAHACVFAGRLEALGDLGAVQRRARLRVREHEIVVVLVLGALRPAIQHADETIGHRHRAPGREVGLARGGVLAPDEGVADANALRHPIDIPPAQPEQLGLTQV